MSLTYFLAHRGKREDEGVMEERAAASFLIHHILVSLPVHSQKDVLPQFMQKDCTSLPLLARHSS
uniref:Uncharacterized protein n=1 Tax=Salix viminalis TaxID=40686 RepID=A0A6N2LNT0_SALVM